MARLLLLAPAFHGYWESLSAEFERRGHEVVAWPYDANDGVLRKVRTKVEELAARASELAEKWGGERDQLAEVEVDVDEDLVDVE